MEVPVMRQFDFKRARHVRAWHLPLVLFCALSSCVVLPGPQSTVRRFIQAFSQKDVEVMLTCIDPRQERMFRAGFKIIEKLSGGMLPLKDILDLYPGLNQVLQGRLSDDFGFRDVRIVNERIVGQDAEVTAVLTAWTRSRGVESTEAQTMRFALHRFEEGWRITRIDFPKGPANKAGDVSATVTRQEDRPRLRPRPSGAVDGDRQAIPQGFEEVPAMWRASPITGDCSGFRDTNDQPWSDPRFDDSRWTSIRLPDMSIPVRSNRFYRAQVVLDRVDEPLFLRVASDDGNAVWVNGLLLGQFITPGARDVCDPSGGCINMATCGRSREVPLVEISPQNLHVGSNTIAAHVHNDAEGSYFDLALLRKRPAASQNAPVRNPDVPLDFPGSYAALPGSVPGCTR
jgi:hypothetical protein